MKIAIDMHREHRARSRSLFAIARCHRFINIYMYILHLVYIYAISLRVWCNGFQRDIVYYVCVFASVFA